MIGNPQIVLVHSFRELPKPVVIPAKRQAQVGLLGCEPVDRIQVSFGVADDSETRLQLLFH
jgi:hypothetical protein